MNEQVNVNLDGWAKVFAKIVEDLPRDEGHTGIFKRDAHVWFYEAMNAGKHPLADKLNKLCNFRQPCGECRRDVRMAAVKRAEAMGLIQVIARKERVVKDDKTGEKQVKRGYVKYYSKSEYIPESGSKMPEATKKAVLDLL